MLSRRTRQYINEKYRVQDLLSQLCGLTVRPGDTFLCPCHDDVNRKSAKLHDDNAFFCYAERKQYTPVELLLAYDHTEAQLRTWVPDTYMPGDVPVRSDKVKALVKIWKASIVPGSTLLEQIGLWHDIIRQAK